MVPWCLFAEHSMWEFVSTYILYVECLVRSGFFISGFELNPPPTRSKVYACWNWIALAVYVFFVGLPKARRQICRAICMFSGMGYLFDTVLYVLYVSCDFVVIAQASWQFTWVVDVLSVWALRFRYSPRFTWLGNRIAMMNRRFLCCEVWPSFSKLDYYPPYHPCMVYLPALTIKYHQM